MVTVLAAVSNWWCLDVAGAAAAPGVSQDEPAPAEARPVVETLAPPVVLTPAAAEVAGVANPCLSLSGEWRFHPSPPPEFVDPQHDTSAWKTIQVPGEWFMQGFTVPGNTAAGYRRTFRVPGDFANARLKLRFDAVYSDATVWLNGHLLGRHLGGFTPFEFDVTDCVQPGSENTLALAVKRESVADLKMTTFGTAYIRTPLGGILRKITLRAVPAVHLASCNVATQFDRDYRDATLRVTLDVANQSDRKVDDVELTFLLLDPQGKPVAVSPGRVSLPAIEAGGGLQHEVSIPVAAPAAWDCEHPNLYRLTCRVLEGGKPLEAVCRRVGFRQVEVRGRQLFVNNRPVKLRGVCRHERHATLGRSLTPELWRKDIELFRAANINLIRTSHYPPPEGLLDVCDELGMFVESEAPFHHAQFILEPEYRRLTVRQTAEMVEHHRNHPSVLIWSLGNEAPWSPNFEASAEMVRELDPTRPRLFSGGDHYLKKLGPTPVYRQLEIGSFHYPGPGGLAARLDRATRPMLFDEYCHLNCYNLREQATDPGIRDDWGHCLVGIWERMYAHEACLGGALWGGIDEIVFPPSGPPAGWGAWGLIDAWHRRKPEHWHAKKAYSPVRVQAAQGPLPAKGEPIRVAVANRHDFTNLSELDIRWRLGDQSGKTAADIDARASGVLLVQPAQPPRDGDVLELEFHSPRGFLIDTYRLTLGKPTPPPLPCPALKTGGKLRLDRNEDAIVATNDRVAWRWDARTGMLCEASLDGRPILAGGPHLMLLPRMRENYRQTMLDEAKHRPFTAPCSEWEATAVAAEATEQGVELRVDGHYREAEGSYRIELDPSGNMVVHYRFAAREKIDPRQIGLVMDAPRALDTVAWRRQGLWAVYPSDHIGRIEGCARATRGNGEQTVDPRRQPDWPWALDATALGTNDFRATRTSVHWAALYQSGGPGVVVDGNGRQAVRTWLDGQRVRLLVADYSVGSGETFLVSRSFWKPHLLKEGSIVEGRVHLRLTAIPPNVSLPTPH